MQNAIVVALLLVLIIVFLRELHSHLLAVGDRGTCAAKSFHLIVVAGLGVILVGENVGCT